MVPVVLLTIGLCFTKLEFDLTLFSRRVIPDCFPLKQRILVNEDLPPRKNIEDTSGEEFDDQDENISKNTTKPTLIQDLKPIEILVNFPKKMEESLDAFYYELVDLEPKVHEKRLEVSKWEVG